MEGDRLKREDSFACLIHGFDRILETLRGDDRSEVTAGIYDDPDTSGHRPSATAGAVSVALGSCRPDADRIGLGGDALVSNGAALTTSGEVRSRGWAYARLKVACVVVNEL